MAVLATTGGGGEEDSENESTLASLQRGNTELAPMIEYLETGVLLQDDQDARRIVLSSGQYTLEDDILYHVEEDGTLRVVPPVHQRERLFAEAKFGAHLGDAKVYSEIKKHYWWVGMRRDITRWTRGCIVCVTQSVGRAVKPDSHSCGRPIRLDRCGYAPVPQDQPRQPVFFMDYLAKWPEVFAYPTKPLQPLPGC